MDQTDIDQLVSEDLIDINGILMDQVMDIFRAGGSFTVNGILQNVLMATHTIDVQECLKNLESQGLIEIVGENPLRWQLVDHNRKDLLKENSDYFQDSQPMEYENFNEEITDGYRNYANPSGFDNSTESSYKKEFPHPKIPGNSDQHRSFQRPTYPSNSTCPPPPSAALFQSLVAQCKHPSAPVLTQPSNGRDRGIYQPGIGRGCRINQQGIGRGRSMHHPSSIERGHGTSPNIGRSQEVTHPSIGRSQEVAQASIGRGHEITQLSIGRGRAIHQSYVPPNMKAKFPTPSVSSVPPGQNQTGLTEIYDKNRFPHPTKENSNNFFRPQESFQTFSSVSNAASPSYGTNNQEKYFKDKVDHSVSVEPMPLQRPSLQNDYQTNTGSVPFPQPPSAEMFRTLQSRGPQKTKASPRGSTPGSGSMNLNALESKALHILKEEGKPCQTLKLAHACGKQRKKDVNPSLYRLQSLGLIIKAHDNPPTWKLRSDNIELINSLVGVSNNPNKEATVYSNPFGKRILEVDDRPLQKMAHISVEDQPNFGGRTTQFPQKNNNFELGNSGKFFTNKGFSQNNTTPGLGNSGPLNANKGFSQSNTTSGLSNSCQSIFNKSFPQSNASSGFGNSENQTQALSKIVHSAINQNPVSALNEYAQKNRLELTYETINEKKGFNKPPFTVAVVLGNDMYPPATASTMKDAKREACDAALRCLLGQNMGQNAELNISQPSAETLRGARTHFDLIAALSQHAFVQLAATIQENIAGRKVVACFVMKRGQSDTGLVVSLGSGNRCVTGERLSMEGKVVNDSHAEIVARRSLHRFLYAQIKNYYSGGDSIFEQSKNSSCLALKSGISFHLYISTAPCGDGALFTPRRDDELAQPQSADGTHSPEFSSKTQGILRTKIEDGEGTIPIDPNDGPQTWDGLLRGQRLRTMSCSDKICRWNVVGLQGALLSHFIEPIYLGSLTLGYLYEHGHLSRAVCCRLQHKSNLGAELERPFQLNHPLLGRVTAYEASRHTEKTNNLSLNWAHGDMGAEVIDGRTGACLSRTKNTPTPARICKASLYGLFKELCLQAKRGDLMNVETYREAKDSAKQFQMAKRRMYEYFKKSKYGSWVSKPIEQEMF